MTKILTEVMRATVPHFNFHTVRRFSAIRAIRLMIICIRSWISKTQQNIRKNNVGILHEVSVLIGQHHIGYSRRPYVSIEKHPSKDSDADVCCNLTPQHVDVRTPQGILVPARLLDGFPYCQKAKADGEPTSKGSHLDVGFCCGHVVLCRAMQRPVSLVQQERSVGGGLV